MHVQRACNDVEIQLSHLTFDITSISISILLCRCSANCLTLWTERGLSVRAESLS